MTAKRTSILENNKIQLKRYE